jgi:hypothetical protein
MLWNARFLHLHIPKTAGKSLTRFFVDAWQRPIYGSVSAGQIRELADCDQTDLHLQLGRGHENLKLAQDMLQPTGRDIESFDAVFVCTRNPYDLMVSSYHFMRQSYTMHKNRTDFALAANSSFEEFCSLAGPIGPQEWMVWNERPLQNLKVIRFERLRDDLQMYAKTYGFASCPLPHLNPSRRGHYRDYLTPVAEKYIYRKFRYWFDNGYYEREPFGNSTD